MFFARHRIYRHAGPTDLKRCSFLSYVQGGSPQPRHRRATSPYNLANLVNLVNPAHLWLILFRVLGLARDRPSPYGPGGYLPQSKRFSENGLEIGRIAPVQVWEKDMPFRKCRFVYAPFFAESGETSP